MCYLYEGESNINEPFVPAGLRLVELKQHFQYTLGVEEADQDFIKFLAREFKR